MTKQEKQEFNDLVAAKLAEREITNFVIKPPLPCCFNSAGRFINPDGDLVEIDFRRSYHSFNLANGLDTVAERLVKEMIFFNITYRERGYQIK